MALDGGGEHGADSHGGVDRRCDLGVRAAYECSPGCPGRCASRAGPAPPPAGGTAPVIAVLALNEGTETTDFLVPHAVLQLAQVGVVEAVAPRAGAVTLIPALQVEVPRSFAAFDSVHPQGQTSWWCLLCIPKTIRRYWLGYGPRRPKGLWWSVSAAGPGCWAGRGCWVDATLLRRHAGAVHVPGQRYVADGPVVTTTGVSASLPVSLALVETLAGAERARAVATALGMPSWGPAHRSERFGLSLAHVGTLSVNTLLFWRHERIDIPVMDGVDDVALALAADAWSRTYSSRAEAVNALASPVHLRSGLVLRAAPPNRLLKYSPPTLCACHRGRTIETFPRTTRLAIHARSRHLHRKPVHHAPSR